MTQQEIIINELWEHREGISRTQIMTKFNIIDVPTRVFEIRDYFRDKGYSIETKKAKNKTAIYFLRPIETMPQKPRDDKEPQYEFINGTAYLKDIKPEQLQIE